MLGNSIQYSSWCCKFHAATASHNPRCSWWSCSMNNCLVLPALWSSYQSLSLSCVFFLPRLIITSCGTLFGKYLLLVLLDIRGLGAARLAAWGLVVLFSCFGTMTAGWQRQDKALVIIHITQCTLQAFFLIFPTFSQEKASTSTSKKVFKITFTTI